MQMFITLSDIHTEAVQAALAKHKEQKMALPMPTKRRSTFVQSPADACTPPGKFVTVFPSDSCYFDVPEISSSLSF